MHTLRRTLTSLSGPPSTPLLAEVEAKIFQVLRTHRRVEIAPQPHHSFEQLGFDSLGRVELVIAVEEALGIDLDDREALALTNVQQTVNLFYRKAQLQISS
jgi:acyl carrier protein